MAQNFSEYAAANQMPLLSASLRRVWSYYKDNSATAFSS
jgi:hypothetical protein